MLSLKKICIQTLSRAAKVGNMAVLGPQIFLPEIYPHYMRQIEIDARGGSERCYLTTERDLYLLCIVYVRLLKYFDGSCFSGIVSDIYNYMLDKEPYNLYSILPIHDYTSDNACPLTNKLYSDYEISQIDYNDVDYICENMIRSHWYELPSNLHIFVYDLPPLLIALGLLFGRIKGPKYVGKCDIHNAREVMYATIMTPRAFAN
jgi:hypothetical protein